MYPHLKVLALNCWRPSNPSCGIGPLSTTPFFPRTARRNNHQPWSLLKHKWYYTTRKLTYLTWNPKIGGLEMFFLLQGGTFRFQPLVLGGVIPYGRDFSFQGKRWAFVSPRFPWTSYQVHPYLPWSISWFAVFWTYKNWWATKKNILLSIESWLFKGRWNMVKLNSDNYTWATSLYWLLRILISWSMK